MKNLLCWGSLVLSIIAVLFIGNDLTAITDVFIPEFVIFTLIILAVIAAIVGITTSKGKVMIISISVLSIGISVASALFLAFLIMMSGLGQPPV